MIKLLIADVDGTLVTKSKALTPRTIAAVGRLRAAGVTFTITSGRPPRGLAKLVEPLGLTAPMAAFNGAMYVKPDLTTVLAQHTIPPEVARTVVDYLLGAGLDVWVYRGNDWYVRRIDAPRVARESSNVGFEPIVVPDLHAVLEAPVKIVGVSEDHALVAAAEAELSTRLGAEAAAARSQPYYLDVTHPEANKGMVVREASRILHIPLEDIATIGDMPNDIPMLSVAGLGIAMGNSGPEVQRVARHVTATNEDEGFARAVDEFILGEPPVSRTALGLPPRARAGIFALDGVLFATAKLHAEAWKRLADHYLRRRAQASGEPFVPFDVVHDFGAHFDGKPAAKGLRSFLDARGIELLPATIQALVEQKNETLNEVLAEAHVEVYEGSLRYVQAARAAGLRTAAVAADGHCEATLRAAGVADLFDVRVEGAPDPYAAAADALGVEREQAVVFEDELAGIETGRTDHFAWIVGVDRQGRAGELRRRGADVVVSDLSALLAAA
jgi:Cof subfamily protein (haloacid dehalogenase superfamily)